MTLSQNGIDYICQRFGDINLCCVKTGLSWYYTREGTNYNETGGTAQIISRLASGLIESLTMTSPDRGTFTQAELNAANGSPVTIQDAQEIAYHDEPTEVQWCYVAAECSPDGITKCVGFDLYTCVGGKWVLTETNSPSCEYVPPECSDYTTQAECTAAGCYWWSDNTCHSTPETPPDCEGYTNNMDCIAAGCYWWSGSCHSTPPQLCSDLNNEIECLSYGCFWYDGSCHAAPKSEIPYWWWIPVVAGVSIIGLYIAAKKKKG